MAHWKSIVEELTKSFEEHDKRLEFLRKIDENILCGEVFEDICKYVVDWLVGFTKADLGYMLVNTGQSLVPFICSSIDITSSKAIQQTDKFDELVEKASIYARGSKELIDASFTPFLADTSFVMLVPINDRRVTDIKKLWGLFGLEFSGNDGQPANNDIELLRFLEIAGGQLEIAIRARSQLNDLKQLSRIQDDLFAKELDITESIKSILDSIIDSFQDLGPLKIVPDPEVQIMFYSENDEFLVIKATTGPESLNTRVSTKDSISGHLVEHPSIPFYLCDPTYETERYKSYLGTDEKGGASKQIRTELVIPIKIEGSLIGVINLESENIDAFKIFHIVTLQKLAEKAAPIINALQKRLEKIQAQDKASVYSMKRFLNRSGAVFTHDLKNDRATVKSNLDQIEKRLKQLEGTELSEKLLKNLDRSKEYFEKIRMRQNTFFENLAGYLALGKFSASNIISGAVKESYPDELKEKHNIEIVFDPEIDYEIFCSPYFKEHIFNLLNNSVYSIREKQNKTKNFIGKIEIMTELVTDEVESDINKQCMITVRDNGIGLDKDSIDKLRAGGFTTKPSGEGLGVSACFHYLKSVGGKIDIDGKTNEYFKVKMFLDIYDEKLHGKDKNRHELRK